MIITEQERKDLVAIFNAQDAAKGMRCRDIKVFDTVITCCETGMIKRRHKRYGYEINTFGTKQGSGYLHVSIDERQVRVHRLMAMAFIDNYDKDMQIDHIDGDKQNNAIDNLRQVTSSQNHRAFRKKSANCSSKYRGVTYDKRYGVWYAKVKTYDITHYVGCFKTEKEAAIAWNESAVNFGFTDEAMNQLP